MIVRIPAEYTPCALRNVTPACADARRIGLGFDAPSGVVRVSLSVSDARALADMLGGYISALAGSQSPMSELMPRAPMSVPSLGENV